MVDKHGLPLAVNLSKANAYDTVGIVPALREAAADGFCGNALGDLSYRSEKLRTIGRRLGIEVEIRAGGAKEIFNPTGYGG